MQLLGAGHTCASAVADLKQAFPASSFGCTRGRSPHYTHEVTASQDSHLLQPAEQLVDA